MGRRGHIPTPGMERGGSGGYSARPRFGIVVSAHDTAATPEKRQIGWIPGCKYDVLMLDDQSYVRDAVLVGQSGKKNTTTWRPNACSDQQQAWINMAREGKAAMPPMDSLEGDRVVLVWSAPGVPLILGNLTHPDEATSRMAQPDDGMSSADASVAAEYAYVIARAGWLTLDVARGVEQAFDMLRTLSLSADQVAACETVIREARKAAAGGCPTEQDLALGKPSGSAGVQDSVGRYTGIQYLFSIASDRANWISRMCEPRFMLPIHKADGGLGPKIMVTHHKRSAGAYYAAWSEVADYLIRNPSETWRPSRVIGLDQAGFVPLLSGADLWRDVSILSGAAEIVDGAWDPGAGGWRHSIPVPASIRAIFRSWSISVGTDSALNRPPDPGLLHYIMVPLKSRTEAANVNALRIGGADVPVSGIVQSALGTFAFTSRPATPAPVQAIIHHSLTSQPSATVAALKAAGRSTHFEVDQVGVIHQYGDPALDEATHAVGFDARSVGIHLTGGSSNGFTLGNAASAGPQAVGLATLLGALEQHLQIPGVSRPVFRTSPSVELDATITPDSEGVFAANQILQIAPDPSSPLWNDAAWGLIRLHCM